MEKVNNLTYENLSEVNKSMREMIGDNALFLISADKPGCGSSTLFRGMLQKISDKDTPIEGVQVGARIREILNVSNESELQSKLDQIKDMSDLDEKIYTSIPSDRVCVVDGKLASTVAPRFVDPNSRPIVSIDLTADSLVSAKRIMQREGGHFDNIFRSKEGAQSLLQYVSQVEKRSSHDHELVDFRQDTSEVTAKYKIDTGINSSNELIEYFSGYANFIDVPPEWEFEALRTARSSLASLSALLDEKAHPRDMPHINYQLENLRYNTDRLRMIKYPPAINLLRGKLKESIVDSLFGLMTKEVPRFFEDSEGQLQVDVLSHKWTPEYYKIAEAWPLLSTILKDKDILDPFGGAGTSINLLVARGIPKTARLMDRSYQGGVPLEGTDYRYRPDLNQKLASLLFDNLPSWYRPDFSPIQGYDTCNASNIPMPDNSVDYIVTDPPYGKNCEGSIGVLFGSLSEFARVAKLGSVVMLPVEWIKPLKDAHYDVEELTSDISRETSKLPVSYVLIKHNKGE